MNELQIWWFHLKMRWCGDWRYARDGGGIIPCERCGRLFKSYAHQDSDGSTYDNQCRDCEFKAKSPIKTRNGVERILTAYNLGIIDWQGVKAYLRAEGIHIKERGDQS